MNSCTKNYYTTHELEQLLDTTSDNLLSFFDTEKMQSSIKLPLTRLKKYHAGADSDYEIAEEVMLGGIFDILLFKDLIWRSTAETDLLANKAKFLLHGKNDFFIAACCLSA